MTAISKNARIAGLLYILASVVASCASATFRRPFSCMGMR